MHTNCRICAGLNREQAYRWMGENHWIPATHGANWIGGDLEEALRGLGLGEAAVLDYRGSVPHAPVIAIRRSLDDVFTAQGPDGWREIAGGTRWRWQPSDGPNRIERIRHELMTFLQNHRGARGLILLPPE